MERDVCLIGKGKAAADVLLVSPAVSRLHARLTWDGETYCISDLNSKNGTFINDKLLSVGETYALNAGDKIQFADLTYRFKSSILILTNIQRRGGVDKGEQTECRIRRSGDIIQMKILLTG